MYKAYLQSINHLRVMEVTSNHVTSETGQTDANGRTSLVFSIRGPIPIQLGKHSQLYLWKQKFGVDLYPLLPYGRKTKFKFKLVF